MSNDTVNKEYNNPALDQPQSQSGEIFKAIAEVMAKASAISKSQRNKDQGFYFRGIDDVYNTFHTLLAEAGVFAAPYVLSSRSEERVSRSGSVASVRILLVRTRFFAKDGSYVDTVTQGEGADTSDKASNKAMAAANKYAYLQLFCVPTDDMDEGDKEDPINGQSSTGQGVTRQTTPRKADKSTASDDKSRAANALAETMASTLITPEERTGLRTKLSDKWATMTAKEIDEIRTEWENLIESRKSQDVPKDEKQLDIY